VASDLEGKYKAKKGQKVVFWGFTSTTRSMDALDAFIATFAGRAAANRTLKLEKPSSWKTEGAIAVHA
jgi:hypothetical protein